MPFSNHGVAFPITEPPSGVDDGRARINRDLVENDAAPVISSIAFAPRFLTAQIAVQVAA